MLIWLNWENVNLKLAYIGTSTISSVVRCRVISISGSICQAKGAISFGNGECLKTVTNESMRWYDARNLCLENGGDLPIFENTKLINRTQQMFNQFNDAIGIWIGLRKTWWQWKKTGNTCSHPHST